MFKQSFLLGIASIGSFTGLLFGGWDYLLTILLACVILDYITGLLSAIVHKKFNSRIGYRGIAQKILIFILVAVANFMDVLLWDENFIRNTTILFYTLNEIISITDNAKRVGLPVPQIIINAIQALQNRFKK
ncbi:phage holin family protein [Priestia endophytica]|uniref:phage holin family protein n=1 Tax=Priestia endophytica TaxID=135735 RepID=UPI002280C26B|nr:phage holin family protein [Priestia endophytica]MCY8234386.1 phage holin family protein [Priestia endophytica]